MAAVYSQIGSAVLGLVLCGAPFLAGCGFVSRIQGWDTNQRTLANASVARTAIEEHLKTQELLGPAVMTQAPQAPQAQLPQVVTVQPPALPSEAQELVEHERALGRLRRAYELENEMRKHDLMRRRLLNQSRLSIDGANDKLLQKFLADEYGVIF